MVNTASLFPEQSAVEYDDPALFAHLAHNPNAVQFVVNDFTLNPDYTAPSVTVSDIVATLYVPSMTTADYTDNDPSGAPSKTVEECSVTVQIPGETRSLSPDTTNYIYLAADDSDASVFDDVFFRVKTTDTAPSPPSMKIGEVDTVNNTTTKFNEYPDGTYATLEAVDSLTDPGGVTHTGSLAAVGHTHGTGDLSFDPATQTELDNHASAASAHHAKTTSLADIADADPSEIRSGTLSNQPTYGTSGRWYFTTDQNGIYYDTGSAWNLIAEHPSNISAGDLGFDPATQTELDNHASAAGAHHTKTTSLADIADADPSEIREGTLSNLPGAGTADRWYFTTDQNGIYHDTGASWNLIAEHPSNIASGDLGFDPATQSELDTHASTAGVHHSRYADSEAVSAAESQDPLSPGSVDTSRVDTPVYASRGDLLTTDSPRTKSLTRGGPAPTMGPTAAQFEDVSNIDLYDFEVDTTESFMGTQCIRNVSGTTGAEAYWYPSSPIDISSLQPSVAFKHSGSGAADIAIKCRDSNGNYFQYRRTVNPSKHATGWHVVDIGASDTQAGTGADLTSIDLIRLTVGGFTSGPVKVDNFQWVEQPSQGAVLFIFDDANQTIYDNALPEFEARGLAGTVGVISSLVDSDGSTMTSAELTEMADKGWSMMSHGKTNTDIKGATASTQREEFEDGKEWLLRNGYQNGPDSIIYKGGGYDVQALDIAEEYYQAGFTTGSSSSGTSPFYCRNPLNITRPFISGHTTTTIQNIIDRTKDTGSLNALGFHTVSSSGDITQANLATVLDYCVNNNVRVLTLDQYLDEHQTMIG